MFDRKKFKYFAIQQLGGRWAIPVATSCIAMAFSFLFQFTYTLIEVSSITILGLDTPSYSYESTMAPFNILSIMFIVMLIFILGNSILQYASSCMYLKMSYTPERITIEDYFHNFKEFGRAMGTYLWTVLWTFLWMLLFFVPGFIKNYEYSQTTFIAAENKKLSIRESMKLSMIITNGYKADLFILDLSFLGWLLLSNLFTLGLGELWLMPYMYMTRINAYHYIMQDAIKREIIPEEYLSKLNDIYKQEKPEVDTIGYTEKIEASISSENKENNESENIIILDAPKEQETTSDNDDKN